MKKCIRKMLPLLLAMPLVLAACGEYHPAARPTPETGESESATAPIVTDASGNVDEDPFTVTLMCDGEPYIPAETQPVSVEWNDGFSLHTAPIGRDGVARIGGLDGDYDVTLSAIPEGYAYNPNIYIATNKKRNIEIELYRLVPTNEGTRYDLYKGIKIKNTGLYCIEFTKADEEVFFEFAPPSAGTYSVESWNDITDNVINPSCNYYGANASYKRFQYTVDDGGKSGSYTKNFKLNVQIAKESISANGAAVFTFGVKASSKTSEYPVKVYFSVTLDGEYKLPNIDAALMLPGEPLRIQEDYSPDEYEFVGAESVLTVDGNTGNVFDGDQYRLWPKSEGGDDYYHLVDLSKADPVTGKLPAEAYGPILYAKISAPCRFMGEPFTTLEYQGNKALTLENGTQNYKLFIEGYAYLNSYTLSATNPNGKPPYFCTLDCPCRLSNTCSSVGITGSSGACITGCEKCHQDCRNISAEAIGHKGYGNYTNSDGCYAVTAELKDFLQKYSISQLLFFDGNGFVETNQTIRVYAEEDDQWLFACGYYKKK